MKKYFLIIFLLISVFFIGCKNSDSLKAQKYLDDITIPLEVSTDFYLPRMVNGEDNHIITWESSDEAILNIGNIVTITGLEYYEVKIARQESDVIVKIKATVDLFVRGTDQITSSKEFKIIVKEDLTIKAAKVEYIKQIIAEFDNLEIKDSITFPVETEEFNLKIQWKSYDESVISSTGVFNAPAEDKYVYFDVTVLDNSSLLYETKIKIKAINKNKIDKEFLLDFVSSFDVYASRWGSSYIEKIIDNNSISCDVKYKVTLSRANRQPDGNSISDRPVIAAKNSIEYITIEVEGESLQLVEFELKQWSSKVFDSIYIEYYYNQVWVKSENRETIPGKMIINNLPDEVYAVRVCIKTSSSKNVQLGLTSIRVELK